jgi:hypothetical protein
LSLLDAPRASRREECLQQLSYLSGLTRGLADPEADVIDLDASLDESDSAVTISASPGQV